MGINTNAVQRLYTAYFSRPADPVGLAYWESKLPADRAATQAELTTLAHSGFSASTEFSNMYTGLTNAQIVQLAYQNLFGRSAEPAGEVYWAARLASGAETFAGLVLQLTYSAQGTDATAIASKLSAATAFTAALDTTAEITGYAGTGSSASARGWLATVTDAATLATATAAATLNTAVAAAVAAGSTDGGGTGTGGTTFNLTNIVDNGTANVFTSRQVFTPGGTDRINSLQDNDRLTGAGTNPTLNATIGHNADTGDTTIMPTMSGVSVVNVAFDVTGYNLDLQDSTGVTEANITRMESGATNGMLRMTAVPTTMSVSNSSATATAANFSFNNSTATGTTDAATLKLSNARVTTISIADDATFATNGVETLTVNSVGSANTVGTLNAIDVYTLNITGDKDLTIGTINDGNTNGQFTTINGSTATGNLNLTIDNALNTDMTATTGTGAAVTFSMKTGSGNDTINITANTLVGNSVDSVDAGTGTDTAAIAQSTTNTVTSTTGLNGAVATSASFAGFEAVTVTRTTDAVVAATNVTVDMSRFTGDQTIRLTNTGDATDGLATYTLNQLSATEAGQITIAHSNNTNNAIGDNLIVANLATATGTSDTVAVTVVDGSNTEARFNFGLTAANVENVTLTDSDTETNTVQLNSSANHTGTVTIAGGVAGTTMNLDTNGANGGIYGLDVTGTATDLAGATDGSGNIALGAATITAAGYKGNAVVRVSTNAADVNGAQTITMGDGNDTVVFDNAADFRAGLTISDRVAGGAGSDTLALDGTVAVTLGASEWTNVTGFETIKTVGTGVAYNLTLTDALIDNNAADGAKINIVNDNDTANDTGAAAGTADTAGTGAESAITVDARTLAATNSFTYNGEEGASRTADRFIFADQNINGNAVINGGAIDNDTDNRGTDNAATVIVEGNATIANLGNNDVIEVRNQAVVSTGDLAGISNVGKMEFTNDLAVTQTSTLQLNDTIVDAMVDSYQASASRSLLSGQNVEVLQVSALDNVNVAAATTGMIIEAGALTDKSDTSILLGRGANNVVTGAGQDAVTLLGNYVAGTYPAATVNGIALNTYSTAGAVARVVTDTINLGNGTDTLTTYGAINLAGATLAGIENLVANSAVVMTAAQFEALTSLTFVGNTTHQLTIIGAATGALNFAKINLGASSGANGSLIIDTAAVTGGFGTTGAVVDNSTTGGATTGVIGTTPTNLTTNNTVALAAGGTFTGTAGVNDNFVGTIASLNGTTVTGTAADTETLSLTDAGTVNINDTTTGGTVTNVDSLTLANGTNAISFTGTSGIMNVTGGTGADSVTVTNMTTGGIINLAEGADTLLGMTEAFAEASGASIQGGANTGGSDEIRFATGTTLASLDMSKISGFETVDFGAAVGAVISNFQTGATTLKGDTTNGDMTINMTAAQLDALATITSGAAGNTFSIVTSDTSAVTVNLADTAFTTLLNVDSFNFSASAANLVQVTIDEKIAAMTAGTNIADKVTITADLGAGAALVTTGFEIIETAASQTGLTVSNSVTTVNASAGGTFTLGSGSDTFTGTGSTAYSVTTAAGGGSDVITTGSGVDTITIAQTTGRSVVTTGVGGDTIVITAADGREINAQDFDFGGAGSNDNLQLTATAGIENANGDASAVTTAIDAGNFAITSIAVDTAISTTATSAFLLIASGADNTAVSVAAATTTAIIEAAIVAQLVDGTDIATNLNTGEGFYGLIANDANADGAVDSYFMFEYIAAGTATTSEVGDIILVGIFSADAANANAGDFI